MEVTLSHKEPTLKAVNPHLKKDKKECNPSVNIVASLNNTIKKLALIREEITKCANIEEQIKLVADLNMDEILNLRKLLEKTYEKNYGDNTKDAIEVLETKYTEKELDDIHSVRGAIPAITTLASREAFEGIETPLHCIVYLWKNFEILADLYQMKIPLKELWERKENLDKLSQPTFQGQMEILTGNYKSVIEEVALSLPSIATCYDNIVKLTKLSDNVEKLLEVLDNLPLLETIQQELPELSKITDNIDDIMLVRQFIHNINTLAQNIDKIDGSSGNTGGNTNPKPNPNPTPTPPTKTEIDTTLTANKTQLDLKVNQSETINFTTNASSVNVSANPSSNVTIQTNGLSTTITPLVAGDTTLTIKAKANEDANHTYREKTITILVRVEKIEEQTTLTQTVSNTTLELNKRPRNAYTIEYNSNANTLDISANPADKVNISVNDKTATITPLVDGNVTITARGTADETNTHIYTENTIDTSLTINPIKPYQRLYAGDFTLMNKSGSKTDNLDNHTINGGPIGQFSGTSCPSQLKACLLLNHGINTYRGMIFQVNNQYTLTSGYYNPNDIKYYMYGIFGMNLAIAKIDKGTNTFMLSPTPSQTYSLNTNALVYVRFIKISNTQERLRITIINPDNSIISGGAKDLQYTLPAGIQPVLSISQGWQGGNQTIIARSVVGIRADNTEGILQDVSTDSAAMLRQKWQEALDADN